MGAEIEKVPPMTGSGTTGWRVTCPTHALNRLVYSEQHATNLAQLHDRVDHADETEQAGGVTFNIAAAAQAVLDETRTAGQGTALEGALMVWQALTGVHPDPDAIAVAEQYAASGFVAHTAPF